MQQYRKIIYNLLINQSESLSSLSCS